MGSSAILYPVGEKIAGMFWPVDESYHTQYKKIRLYKIELGNGLMGADNVMALV